MFNKHGDLRQDGDRYNLPPQSCSICYWGGGGSPDMSDSMATLATGKADATRNLRNYYEEAAAYLAPWRNAGGSAVNQTGGLLGLPGYTALDSTETLESTPGYKFLQNQGTQALARYGAATGLNASGAAMKGATNYGQKLAQTYAWQPYMSSLQNLSGQGLSAAGTSGGYAMQTGQGTANIDMQTAQQMSQAQQQQAMMDAQSENSWMNDLMSGLGFGGSLIAAPFTGGTSLIGAVGSGLSSLYGALGGGGMSLAEMSNAGQGTYNAFTPAYGGGWKLMADGGPTRADQPYIIGERGPELFIPNVPGYIIPNEYMRYSAFRNQPYRMAA